MCGWWRRTGLLSNYLVHQANLPGKYLQQVLPALEWGLRSSCCKWSADPVQWCDRMSRHPLNPLIPVLLVHVRNRECIFLGCCFRHSGLYQTKRCEPHYLDHLRMQVAVLDLEHKVSWGLTYLNPKMRFREVPMAQLFRTPMS